MKTYEDYTREVCGLLRVCRKDAEQILQDSRGVTSLWHAAANGWNNEQTPEEVVDEWCSWNDVEEATKPKCDVSAIILASRETRRKLWAAAHLTESNHA